MNCKNFSIFFLLIFISTASLMVAGEPGRAARGGFGKEPKFRVTPVYYDLIGIEGFDAIIKRALEFVEQTPDFKRLDAKIRDLREDIEFQEQHLVRLASELEEEEAPGKKKALQAQQEKAQQIVAEKTAEWQKALRELQELRQSVLANVLERDIPKSTIQKKCKEKREALQKKRQELERALKGERLAWDVREKKGEEFEDVQYEIAQTAHACPILLDDKRRAAYDYSLAEIREEPKGFFDALRRGVRAAIEGPPDKEVILNEIAGKFLSESFKPMLNNLFGDIPEVTAKFFNQEIALRSIDFLPRPGGQDVRYWVGFSGLMRLNRFNVRVSVYIVKDIYGIMRMSIGVELPEFYKLSDLIPGFTYLDTFSLPRSRLVFSNFSYFDRVSIKKGLTFVAEVDLSGPLKILSDLKDRSKYTKSLVFESEPVLLTGYLPKGIFKNYLDTEFELRVPFHFGFDFRQISFIPQSVSNVVNQVTSDDFRLTIRPRESQRAGEGREARAKATDKPRTLKETELAREAAQEIKPFYPRVSKEVVEKKVEPTVRNLTDFARFNIEAEAGARIVLGTQKDPLQLTLLGAIRPSWSLANSSLLVAVNLKKMLELKWLAIGDAVIQFVWDTALMPAAASAGLPFTGFGMRGKLDLGKPGASRAHFKVAGGFNVSTADVPDLLFNVRGTNIRFADLLSYASYLATKARILKRSIPVQKIPTMTFKHVEGYASLANMRIGKESYPAGLGLHVEMELFNKKFGLRVDMSNEFRLSGFGYMPRVDARIKGRDIFKLYSSEQKDRGPRAAFAFDPKKPLEGRFAVDGALEIPALRLKQDVQLTWSGWNLDTDFESSIAGISVFYGVRINLQPFTEAELVRKQQTLEEKLRRPASPEDRMRTKNELRTVQEEIEQIRAGVKRRQTFKEELPFSGEKEETEKEMFKRLPARLAQIKEAAPRWKQMVVKFGFKQDFAEYMTKVSKGFFQKMKAAASKKLNAAADKMLALKAKGAKGFDAEIERSRRSIARTGEKLKRAQEACAQSRWYKKFKCARVAALKAVILSKKSYLNALLKPTKAVATGVVKLTVAALQKTAAIQEFALELASTGLEVIKEGLNLFTIKEAFGEWSSQDIVQAKLPLIRSLVVEMHIMDEPTVIRLYNVQFDFKNPYESIANITRQVMTTSFSKQAEYAEILGL